MKRAWLIIAAVGTYSLLETVLLLTLDFPYGGQIGHFPSIYQGVVGFGQLLLIPGMAAFVSGISYGRHRLMSRTLKMLLWGVLAIPVSLICVAASVLLLGWSYEASHALFYCLLPLVLVGLVWLPVFVVRKSGRADVEAEAARWLAERMAGSTVEARRSRNRAVRFAVCIPIMFVMCVFLFLPETLGLLSHGLQRTTHLSAYKVRVPMTWIVQYDYRSDGQAGVSGLAGMGIFRGGDPLRYDYLSAWSIGAEPLGNTSHDEKLDDSRILDRHTLKVAGETITCVDYRPPYSYWPYDSYSPYGGDGSSFCHVKCSSSGRLWASFDGRRDQLATFYSMLETVTPP